MQSSGVVVNDLNVKEMLTAILEFSYTISQWMGEKIVGLIRYLTSDHSGLTQLVDPVGVLAVLTFLLLVVHLTRKVAWFIIAAGWFLIIIRIVMILMDPEGPPPDGTSI